MRQILLSISLCNIILAYIAFRLGFEMSTYSVIESDKEGGVVICLSADRGDGSEVYMVTIITLNQTAGGIGHYKTLAQ